MYMTKTQREMVMIVGCKGGAIREFLETNPDITPDEAKRLRTAHTNAEKAMTSYCSRLDPDAKQRLRKELNTSTIQVVVNRDIGATASEKVVKEDDLYTMGELVTAAYCQGECGCQARAEDPKKSWKKCRAYQAMVALGLAPASYEKGECPYSLF